MPEGAFDGVLLPNPEDAPAFLEQGTRVVREIVIHRTSRVLSYSLSLLFTRSDTRGNRPIINHVRVLVYRALCRL